MASNSSSPSFTVADATSISDEKWDQFVSLHPAHALSHLRAMCRLQAGWKVGPEHSLVVLDTQQKLVAVLPLFLHERRVLRLITERSLVSSGISGNGALIAASLGASDRRLILSLLEARTRTLARSLGAAHASVVYPVFAGSSSVLSCERYHPLRPFGWRETLHPTLVIDLALSEDQIFAQFRSSTRSVIRQATRAGAVCRRVADRDEWLGFHEANRWTQGEAALSDEGMQRAWDDLIEPGHAIALCVEHEGSVVCAVVATHVNRVAYYLLAFNSPQSHALGANRLALWHALRAVRQQGARWIEIGPMYWGTGKDATIADFKRGFGGRVWYQTSATVGLTPLRTAVLNVAVRLYQRLRAGRRPATLREPPGVGA